MEQILKGKAKELVLKKPILKKKKKKKGGLNLLCRFLVSTQGIIYVWYLRVGLFKGADFSDSRSQVLVTRVLRNYDIVT